MEIGDIEQFGFPCPYPFLPFVALAFRTVPVATTVIADMYITASIVVAFVDMPTEGRGTALPDGMERT